MIRQTGDDHDTPYHLCPCPAVRQMIKDQCDPVYDETLEYSGTLGEIRIRRLEVLVVSKKTVRPQSRPRHGEFDSVTPQSFARLDKIGPFTILFLSWSLGPKAATPPRSRLNVIHPRRGILSGSRLGAIHRAWSVVGRDIWLSILSARLRRLVERLLVRFGMQIGLICEGGALKRVSGTVPHVVRNCWLAPASKVPRAVAKCDSVGCGLDK